MLPPKTLSKSFAQCERHSAQPRSVANDGCERYDDATPRPPELNKNQNSWSEAGLLFGGCLVLDSLHSAGSLPSLP